MKSIKYFHFIICFFKYIGYFLYSIIVLSSITIASLSIYYSDTPWKLVNIILSILYFFICFYGILINKSLKSTMGLWWLSLIIIWIFYNITTQPSNDRTWREDMTLPARVIVDKDTINIINYREYKYKDKYNFIPHYTDRTVSLSNLTSVDFYISYWMPGPVAHTFLGFNFSDGPPVIISIEARYEKHENYAPIASLFRQFELIYIVGDIDSIVNLRVKHRKEDVYRYRLNISEATAQRLFKEYIYRINELADYPEFYNLLKSNCTINIFRYANQVGLNKSFDIRILLNGLSDQYLYSIGIIDNSKPFNEVRKNAFLKPLKTNSVN